MSSVSSSRTSTRVILEDADGNRPAGVAMDEVHLPGLQLSATKDESEGTTHIRTDGFAADGIDAAPVTSPGSTTTDYDWKHGGKLALRQAAFSNVLIAPYDTGSVNTISSVSVGNILRKADGWGALTAGQIVMVTGFGFNSRFISPVVSVVGNDLALDPSHVSLPDEVPASARVHHAGILKMGSHSQTVSIEGWNPDGAGGWLVDNCSVVDWRVALTWSTKPELVQETFSIDPLHAPRRISSQLPVATNPLPGTSGFSSGPEFQDFLNQESGFGFIFGGTFYPTLPITALSFGFSSPVQRGGYAGLFEPNKTRRDADRPVDLSITCDKYTPAWEAIRDLAQATVTPRAPLGFGWWNEVVARGVYTYLANAKGPTTFSDSGAARSVDQDTFTWMGKGEASNVFSPICQAYFEL